MARRRREWMRWSARRAWCWRCEELVGPPRSTVREALVDLRAHRKAGHPAPSPLDGIRDEFHTMAELYDYRMLYNALAVNAWAEQGTIPVVKSWRHSDGELCFGGGWFIVVAVLPTGMVSNHYEAEHWPLFRVPEGVPPEYDGHTPAVAAERMREFLAEVPSMAASHRVRRTLYPAVDWSTESTGYVKVTSPGGSEYTMRRENLIRCVPMEGDGRG